MVKFSWRPDKAKRNLKKHKVSFTEAMTAFEDPTAIVVPDKDHHDRAVLTGYSADSHLLVVVHIEYIEEEWIRIISARKAKPHERKDHEED